MLPGTEAQTQACLAIVEFKVEDSSLDQRVFSSLGIIFADKEFPLGLFYSLVAYMYLHSLISVTQQIVLRIVGEIALRTR